MKIELCKRDISESDLMQPKKRTNIVNVGQI